VRRLGAAAGRAMAYPFGACSDRVAELTRRAGYDMAFAGAWDRGSDPLRIPRVPVYVWDASNRPLGLRGGAVGMAGRLIAHLANRCSVGTSAGLALTGRYRGGWHVTAAPQGDRQEHRAG
jgi:hypothetical protein